MISLRSHCCLDKKSEISLGEQSGGLPCSVFIHQSSWLVLICPPYPAPPLHPLQTSPLCLHVVCIPSPPLPPRTSNSFLQSRGPFSIRPQYTHIHTLTFTHIHTPTHPHTLTHVHTDTHKHTLIHSYTHRYTHTHLHSLTHTDIHTQIHTCTHMLTLVYTYTHMYLPSMKENTHCRCLSESALFCLTLWSLSSFLHIPTNVTIFPYSK